MAEGIVYILTNEAMPGLVKVGRTGNLKTRMKRLDGTSVPFPFECFYAAKVENMEAAEKLMHEAFGDRRVRANREFFRIDPSRAKAALRLAAKEEVAQEVAGITDAAGLKALAVEEARKPNLNMAELGIPNGTLLTHVDDENLTCEVVGATRVIFDGHVMSLSKAALKAAAKMGKSNQSGAYQGGLYWKFGDQTLVGIRLEKEALSDAAELPEV